MKSVTLLFLLLCCPTFAFASGPPGCPSPSLGETCSGPQPLGRGRRPNIVFIMADDWGRTTTVAKVLLKLQTPSPSPCRFFFLYAGWNDVGYHNPEVLTPNIDELARTGVELDQEPIP